MNLKQALLKVLDGVEPFLPPQLALAARFIRWAIEKYLGDNVAALMVDLPQTNVPAEVQRFVEAIFEKLVLFIPSDFIVRLITPLKSFIVAFLLEKVWTAVMGGSSMAMHLGNFEPQKSATPASIAEHEAKVDEIFMSFMGA